MLALCGLLDLVEIVAEIEPPQERVSDAIRGQDGPWRCSAVRAKHRHERVTLAVQALVALLLAQRPKPLFHAPPR